MPVQIQLRKGTAAQWTSANPTLAAGEAGAETDTKKLKIGDGSTAWNSLAYIGGSGGGISWQAVKTSAFTAIAGEGYPCNTTSGAFTVTLPASPTAGQQITLTDYAGTWNTNNLTVNPNGGKVNGSTGNTVLSTSRGSVQLVYVDSTQGWLVYSSFAITALAVPLEYLVVGGGGGGGSSHGGGGGAGGLLTNIGGSAINGTFGNSLTITVGTGGSGGAGSGGTAGSNGATSSISGTGITTITALGGGGGGGRLTTGLCTQAGAVSSGTVGSGGGGAGGGTTLTGVGTSGQGNNGGNGSSNAQPAGAGNGGGGGGAGFPGGAATGTDAGQGVSGTGGNGLQNAITGTNTYYAGGGSGGRWEGGSVGAAGLGGGGAGGIGTGVAGSAGTNGLGGGGGGGSGGGAGAKGGDGVVIIRYSDALPAATSTTGSPTITTTGGYRIYKWTGNGSITF